MLALNSLVSIELVDALLNVFLQFLLPVQESQTLSNCVFC